MFTHVSQGKIRLTHLLAYLEGESHPYIILTIEAAPHLLECCRLLQTDLLILQAKLYRYQCPDSLVLGEYVLQMLSNNSLHQLERHLQVCRHCQRELKQMQQMIESVFPKSDHAFDGQD